MSFSVVLAAALAVWIALCFLVTPLLNLQPRPLLALRLILIVFGVLIAAAISWYRKRTIATGSEKGETGPSPPENAGDLEHVLREAQHKVARSKLGAEARLDRVAVIFVTGSAGSSKTTLIEHCGLEPELLAGQVHRDELIAPTEAANVWLAGRAVVIELGTGIQADPKTPQLLTKYFQPAKLRAAVSRSEGAPRAAVVCCECESLLKPGASGSAIEAARSFRDQLGQLSTALGIHIPVYVLFTKLDRIAFFTDFVRTFNDRESAQVLGVTLPVERQGTGVYGERESARLTNAFQELVLSLSEKRTELLTHESDPDVALSAYEFPREFRKLRTVGVNFLVELCRPSQLSSRPLLRGFYFCGVRPVLIEEQTAAQEARGARPGRQEAFNPDATAIFSSRQFTSEPASTVLHSGTIKRRVPQWVFLPRLFGEVILADRSGLAASTSSAKTSGLRRALWAGVACLCLAFGICALISFMENRALIREVNDSAAAVSSDADSASPASLESLTKLDDLRQHLVQLREWQRTRPPLSMRWGLYQGLTLLGPARRIYFDRFRRILFGGVQAGLLSTMQSWPSAPAQNADYGYCYNTLKAYLETTSDHDKATLQFLPRVLEEHWTANQNVDPQRAALGRKQFDFYTSELVLANPYSSTADMGTVRHARRYLAQFAGAARVYEAMLTGANQNNKPLMFSQRFPGSVQVVVNNLEVPGAFTKPGFMFMDSAVKDPDKYVSGEKWVLGNQLSAVGTAADLEQEIRTLYYADYIKTWREYIRRSIVVRYSSLADASRKLASTSSPQSPLLALFWLASQNTDVNAAPVQKAFKPLHVFMPPSLVDQYIGPSNTNYMTALTALQNSVDQASKLSPEQAQAAGDQITSAASSAMLATRQTALTFGLDPDAHIEATIEKLLEDPIAYLDSIKPNAASPVALNAAGADFCSRYRVLTSKIPFDPSAAAAASLDDVNSIFRPQQGALWQFYDQKLTKLLAKQGSAYIPVAGQKPTVTARFLAFFNNAARFSNALYANGTSQDPKLRFALQPAFSSDVQNVQLMIDGQTANFTPNSPAQQFTWPGTGGVRLTVKSGSDFIYPNYDGLWGVFEFFQDADRPLPNPEWMLKSGRSNKPVTSPLTNQPIDVRFNVDMLGAPPIFQKGFLRELACVAEVAR